MTATVDIPSQEFIAQILCIIALIFVCPLSYFFHQYSRSLDLAQLLYAFSFLFAANTPAFSSYLDYAFVSFVPTIVNLCTDYRCSSSDYLLNLAITDLAILWMVALLLCLTVLKHIGCAYPWVKFLPFYNFFKGFMRWFMPPLIYYSTKVVLNSTSFNTNFIVALVILGVFILLSILEVIGYAVAKEGRPSRKWL
jgi:hypothetical protein